MENNLHEDKLDDYVRKSFDGYEEDPAPDMWERVERDLSDERDRPVYWRWWRQYRWQAVAAGVIFLLLSTLICEHLYYQEKLRALTQAPPEINPSNNLPTGTTTVPSTVNPPSRFSTLPPAPYPAAGRETKTIPAAGIPPVASLTTQPVAAAPHDAAAVTSVSALPVASATADTTIRTLSVPADRVAAAEKWPETCIWLHPEPIALPEKTPRQPVSFAVLPTPPVRPVNEPGGWYAGIAVQPMFTVEKGRMPVGRPGRPAFRSEKKGADYTTLGWLTAGKKIGGHLAIESGLGYQQNVRTATHTPQLRFGDGMAGGSMQRSFQYDLNTYGGTAEVSLRMEQSNPGAPPADDEALRLEIETRHRTAILRVPLLLAGEWGSGAWRTRIKAGVLANYFLENELEISAGNSNHPRLRFVDGQDAYTVQLAAKGKLFWGYRASAGVEYRLRRSLGISLDLCTLGDFARKDAAGRTLPRHHAAGLNAGVNYYF
ncbi:MAG: hypothetical protein SFV22_02080 [Saprospiraceae bacterium]|nr:hypothetical protein [Saprospiraceae bacterium]